MALFGTNSPLQKQKKCKEMTNTVKQEVERQIGLKKNKLTISPLHPNQTFLYSLFFLGKNKTVVLEKSLLPAVLAV